MGFPGGDAGEGTGEAPLQAGLEAAGGGAAASQAEEGRHFGSAEKGLDVDNAHLTMLCRLPYNDLNPEVKARFDSNLFSVTRQVHYSATDSLKSVDMVLFLNGLAQAPKELKNPWTGQNVNQAKKQYR